MYSSTAYAPFGEVQPNQTSGTADASFTGQDQDTLSSLYDFWVRRQSSSQGRWISPDPAGTGAVDPATPQSWNRYAYVVNNPLALVDPFGLCDPYSSPDESGNCVYDPSLCPVDSCVDGGPSDPVGTLPTGPGQNSGGSSGGGLGGGGGSATGGAVNKSYPMSSNCNTNAAGVMKNVESNFSQFGNYNGEFGPAGIPMASANVTFGTGSATPVTQGSSIPISLAVDGGDDSPIGSTANVSVTVASVSQSSFTLNTNPGHVLYPASISFSAGDAGSGQINFMIQVNGDFSGWEAEVGYYAGGNNLEDNIWNNFEKNVQASCAGQAARP
jgi:RHS repeat-associated protein